MNIKAVENNTAQAMRGIMEIEDKMKTVYALLDSVRASLEEQGRNEDNQLKALHARNALEQERQDKIDEENKPPTDAAMASLEAQREKPFLQEERDNMMNK